jgi:hypothetical protein
VVPHNSRGHEPTDVCRVYFLMPARSSVDGVEHAKTGPKLLLNQREASAMLGMSQNTFKQHVRPYVGYVCAAGFRYPVVELERWIEQQTHTPLTGSGR